MHDRIIKTTKFHIMKFDLECHWGSHKVTFNFSKSTALFRIEYIQYFLRMITFKILNLHSYGQLLFLFLDNVTYDGCNEGKIMIY